MQVSGSSPGSSQQLQVKLQQCNIAGAPPASEDTKLCLMKFTGKALEEHGDLLLP